jgi:hypothetical protein
MRRTIEGQMKAYIVTNVWAGKTVCKDEFQPCLSTEKFTITEREWALVWSIKTGDLKLSVKGGDPSKSHPSAPAVSASQPSQGIKYLAGPGDFRLEICASGDWSVKVVSVEELNLVSPAH